MNEPATDPWQHDHVFGQDRPRAGEKRTWVVIAVTAITMVVEIASGIAFGSMALLADGLHMASHTLALGIAGLAYVYTRRHAHNASFNFGTGKVNALGGYTGAVLLALFSLLMAWESIARFFRPVEIAFNQAILVAFVGLVVNTICVVILGGHHPSNGESSPEEDGHTHRHDVHHEDHNLRSAYLHVIADALTSILAIVALLAAKFLDQAWLDPAMGIVGAVLVANWSVSLLRRTSRVLLDRQAPENVRKAIREHLEEREGDRITDLHVWSLGPGIRAAIISVVTDDPRPSEHYKGLLPEDLGLVHVTVEVHDSRECPPAGQ